MIAKVYNFLLRPEGASCAEIQAQLQCFTAAEVVWSDEQMTERNTTQIRAVWWGASSFSTAGHQGAAWCAVLPDGLPSCTKDLCILFGDLGAELSDSNEKESS